MLGGLSLHFGIFSGSRAINSIACSVSPCIESIWIIFMYAAPLKTRLRFVRRYKVRAVNFLFYKVHSKMFTYAIKDGYILYHLCQSFSLVEFYNIFSDMGGYFVRIKPLQSCITLSNRPFAPSISSLCKILAIDIYESILRRSLSTCSIIVMLVRSLNVYRQNLLQRENGYWRKSDRIDLGRPTLHHTNIDVFPR